MFGRIICLFKGHRYGREIIEANNYFSIYPKAVYYEMKCQRCGSTKLALNYKE